MARAVRTECRDAGGVRQPKQERAVPLAPAARVARSAARPAVPAPPLRCSRFPVARKAEGQRSSMAERRRRHSPQRRNKPCESVTPSSTCSAVRSAAPRYWSAGPSAGSSIAGKAPVTPRKYRRGAGEILIINHDGHGWWDPLSSAKGDVFDLVQHLDPNLNFGQVCKELRRLIGVAPAFPEVLRPSLSDAPDRPVADRWKRRLRLRPGSAASHSGFDPNGRGRGRHRAGWFVPQRLVRPSRRRWKRQSRRDPRPGYKGSLRGGTKTLFRFGRAGQLPARCHRGADRRVKLGSNRRPSH
jgi:hypothetical protein